MIRKLLFAAALLAAPPAALAQQVAITGGRIVTNTPQGVIEQPASMKGKTGLENMTEQQRPDRGPGGGRPPRPGGSGDRR